MVGPVHRRYLFDGGPHHPSRSKGDDRGPSCAACLQESGRRLGRPDDGTVRGRIGRHDLAMLKFEPVLEPRLQLHAGRDGVFQPERDQPLGERQGDQPLGGGTGHWSLRAISSWVLPAMK